MVIQFFATFYVLVLLSQALFLRHGLTHKAKGDGVFVSIQLISMFIIVLAGLNMLFLHFGETGFLFSKICLSGFAALFIIEIGVFAKIKVNNFAGKSHYTKLAVFIVSIIVAISCSISFINVSNEQFFEYIIVPIRPFYNVISNSPEGERIVVFKPGELWDIYAFCWFALVFIYALLDFMRIVMRSIINSIHELIIVLVFVFQFVFFIKFIDNPSYLCFELSFFCYILPYCYYMLVYEDKPWFIRKTLRSILFKQTAAYCVVFNADDLLVDFNESAKRFFGFDSKDVFHLTMEKFISDYVPIGNVPYDSFSVDQILVKGKNSSKSTCQLEYHRLGYFKNETICSFFIINDISNVVKKFSDIQQASMTDNITGLHAQHVLARKIREINMYRRFPYSVAVCSAKIKNNDSHVLNNNMALVNVSECIRNRIRASDFAAYENGHIVLLFPTELDAARRVMERIEEAIRDEQIANFEIEFQYGIAGRQTPDTDIQETLNEAHSLLFKQQVDKK